MHPPEHPPARPDRHWARAARSGRTASSRTPSIGERCRVVASVLEQAVGRQRRHDRTVRPPAPRRQDRGRGRARQLRRGEGQHRRSRARKMHHFSYVGDATLGADVNVGAGTITCNYDGVNKHRTTVGDGVFIGSDTMLIAPVTLGDGARTGAGSVVNRDVAPGQLVVGVPARPMRSASTTASSYDDREPQRGLDEHAVLDSVRARGESDAPDDGRSSSLLSTGLAGCLASACCRCWRLLADRRRRPRFSTPAVHALRLLVDGGVKGARGGPRDARGRSRRRRRCCWSCAASGPVARASLPARGALLRREPARHGRRCRHRGVGGVVTVVLSRSCAGDRRGPPEAPRSRWRGRSGCWGRSVLADRRRCSGSSARSSACSGSTERSEPAPPRRRPRLLVESVEDARQLEEDEREMIHGIFEMSAAPVREVMVPRIDVVADAARVDAAARSWTGSSRAATRGIPIFDDTIDNVVGVVYAKDVLPRLRLGALDDPAEPIARDAVLRAGDEEGRRAAARSAAEARPPGDRRGRVRRHRRPGHDRGPARRDRRRDPRRVRRERGSADRADRRARVRSSTRGSRSATSTRRSTCTWMTRSSTRSAGWSTTSLAKCPIEGDEVRVNGCLVTVLSDQGRRISKLRVTIVEEAER